MFLAESMEYVTTLPKHSKSESINVVGCRLSDDSSELYCTYSDRSILVWDLKDLQKIVSNRVITSHSGPIWDLDLLPFSQQSFLSASADGTVRAWNFSSEESTSSLLASVNVTDPSSDSDPTSNGVRCVKVSPDGRQFVTGDKQGNLRFVEKKKKSQKLTKTQFFDSFFS